MKKENIALSFGTHRAQLVQRTGFVYHILAHFAKNYKLLHIDFTISQKGGGSKRSGRKSSGSYLHITRECIHNILQFPGL